MRSCKRRGVGREHALRDAVVIAEIDEQQLAVIALAVDPPCQAHGLTHLFGTEHGAGVGPIDARLAHDSILCL